MDIVEVCYKLSMQIPQSEIFGLTSQIQRAAVSIPTNIAEGHGRMNLGKYLRHLSIASGSLKELKTHLIIAGRLQYINEDEIILVLEACSEVGRMLASLIQKLRQKHFLKLATCRLLPATCYLRTTHIGEPRRDRAARP